MKRNVKSGVYTYNGVEENFNFYTTLRSIDKLNFINSVTDILVGDNYLSAIREMIFDFKIIDIMTDIDISNIKNSEDVISAIEDFLESTNIVEIVKANAEGNLIEELNKGVDDNIEYRTGIHKSPVAEGLGQLLNTIEKKISNIDVDGMMNMAQTLSSISGELTVDKLIEAYTNSDAFKQKDAGATIKNTKRSNRKSASQK